MGTASELLLAYLCLDPDLNYELDKEEVTIKFNIPF